MAGKKVQHCHWCRKEIPIPERQPGQQRKCTPHFCSLGCRFWHKVDKTPGHGPKGDCWLWTGSKIGKFGHGCIGRSVGLDRTHLAHRVSWFLDKGVWPSEDLNVCHSCDVPGCVNPVHLFLGTQKDNVDDMVSKGRNPIGSKRSDARLTEEQARLIKFDKRPETVIAAEFGITRSAVGKIRRGQMWRHVN